MNPLSESIADERLAAFVGRADECRWITEWLQGNHSPSYVVAITGMGGIGKSTLILRALQLAQDQGAEVAWIDGRSCFRSPRGFLESLPSVVDTWSSAESPQKKMVLAIDNYEELQPIAGWLREVFLSGLPSLNLLVLIASRANFMDAWRTDPGWRERVHVWTLQDFSPAEIEEFLHRHRWPTHEMPVAHRHALGHPLSLAVLAELRQRQAPALTPDLQETLSARLFREVADPNIQPLVDVLAVVGDASPERLERILKRRVPIGHYHQLQRLSFVKRYSDGRLGLHDLAMMHLFDDLRHRNPSEFDQIRRQSLNVLVQEWDETPPERQGALAQQLLWLCRDVFQETTQYADLAYRVPALEVTGYRTSDHERLRDIIAVWGRQSLPLPVADSLRLFDRIVADYPEAIRVTRREDGRPVACFVALLLHAKTLDLLDQFHPRVVHDLLAGNLDIRRCSPDEANASYNVLTGLDFHDPLHAPQQILGVVARDQFAFQAGILGLLILTNPELKTFLRAMGYQSQPFPVSTPPTPNEELYILDLRHQHFGQWIRRILQMPDGQATPIHASDVADFLEHRGTPDRLENSTWLKQAGTNPGALEELIQDALSPPPEAPMTRQDQEVLTTIFFGPHVESWRQANALHISRATLYRHRSRALSHLAMWLEKKLRQS